MFRIGDFSRLAQVTVRTLRLYDELGLFKPARIDPFTDYRYYTIEQLPRLNRILALKDMGFSLDEVAQLLQGDMPAGQLWDMLAQKQSEIEREVQEAQARLARVQARLKQIEREGQPPQYDVVMKRAAPLWVASVRHMVPHVSQMPEHRHRHMRALYDWLAASRVDPLEPELCLYHNTDYDETNIDMEVGTVVGAAAAQRLRPHGQHFARELPEVRDLASVVYKGDLRNVPEPIVALLTWIGAHGYTSDGPIRELHWWGREIETPDAALCDITLELQMPVTRLEVAGAPSP